MRSYNKKSSTQLRAPEEVIETWREKLRPVLDRINQTTVFDAAGRRCPPQRNRRSRPLTR